MRWGSAKGTKSAACLLKAKVNPSQRTADKAHEAWIIARSSGLIVSAHCTCMAGFVMLIAPECMHGCRSLFSLGEGCSHFAALMFKVECGVRLGYTSSTSQVCKWNSTFTLKVSVIFTPYIGKKHCFVVRLNQR